VNKHAQIFFYFDYVDPGSYVTEKQLGQLLPPEVEIVRYPFELCPPPKDLIDPETPDWIAYHKSVSDLAEELGIALVSFDFMPWTRKAHELRLHAVDIGMESIIHEALFKARFKEGADIGRINVLVNIATRLGLDLTETKAVLDVDRYANQVAELRLKAKTEGVRNAPTIRIGSDSLECPVQISDFRKFLESAHFI
jgi:predicted DsbA family dithiol-disulfide isomerase